MLRGPASGEEGPDRGHLAPLFETATQRVSRCRVDADPISREQRVVFSREQETF